MTNGIVYIFLLPAAFFKLYVCEWDPFSGENIARGRKTYQQPSAYQGIYTSNLAVDGNTSQHFEDKSCSCTKFVNDTRRGASWTVTFNEPTTVSGIRIYNRDGRQERLKNFRVSGLGTNEFYTIYDDQGNMEYKNNIINITNTKHSTQIFSSLTINNLNLEAYEGGKTMLTLCEVQVFSAAGCFAPTLANGKYIKTDQSIKNKYEDGEYILLKCNDGYQDDAGKDKWRQCQANNTWTRRNFSCNAIMCQDPDTSPNGHYNKSSSYNIGDTVVMYCKKGYKLTTDSLKVCQRNGTWSGPKPYCQPVCDYIDDLENGYYTLSNNTYYTGGSVLADDYVNIRCRRGYSKSGEQLSRYCNQNGSWEILQTKCQTCQNFTYSQNIRYEYKLPDGFKNWSNTNYKPEDTIVNAYCVGELFELSGNEGQHCHNGRWNGTKPRCIPICKTPTLAHGRYMGKRVLDSANYQEWQNITAKCNDGYEYDAGGRTSRQCQPDHTWSGKNITCNVIKCNVKEVMNGGYNVSKNVPFDTVISAVCNQGFALTTAHVPRRCLSNKTLSGMEPNCTLIQCSLHELNPSENNYHLYENYTVSVVYNKTVTGSCNEGFEKTAGDSTRKCSEGKRLSGVELVCSRKQCPVPNYVANGKYNISRDGNMRFNSNISFACLPKYELTRGNDTRTCLENKTWSGAEPICQAIVSPESEKTMLYVAIGVGVAGLVILLLVFIVILAVRKRKPRPKERPEKDDNKDMAPCSNMDEINPSSAIKESSIDSQCTKAEAAAIVVEQEPCVDDHAYYNFTTPVQLSDGGIRLSNLSDFVVVPGHRLQECAREFQNFPNGMTKPHKAALKNKGKNKYKNVYAYDDTRVVLEIWNPDKETDYINACYIQGFDKPRAYIASQGAIDDNLNDLWRMIWQTNSGKIVMLTNLLEEQRVKCAQYWPHEGTMVYGAVTVTLKANEVFSNFVIRTFIISKDNDSRQVIHFHFTAWPDKGVPKYASALVHFRCKVKNQPTDCTGPTIVHCSAGIGRTGTYIALDYLTEEGLALGKVDVAGCVETLRQQRVNMVQTKEQYMFVHQALVETLMIPTSALPTSKFPETYRDMLVINPERQKRKIEIEFDTLRTIAPTTDASQYSSAKNVKHREKNRSCNVLPNGEFMPSIHGPGRSLDGGFISAAFLPSYKEPNALIITQTPLESTKEDFWKMIYYQDVHTIVMMNDIAEMKEAEIYWPALTESVKFGNIEIICESTVTQKTATILTLGLKKQCKDWKVKLIQFESWHKDHRLPNSPNSILSCLELVQDWQRQTGNHTVAVHCMDGVEKSGLFCVMYALLERTKIEHDVAIPQVIQEMRNRREQIIPNGEQFQFCHEVVLGFLEQFNTYSNFANC